MSKIWVIEKKRTEENERRREVSGVPLSWRDDPEKSGVQNGLPGKEVYSIGRRRRRRRLQVFICYTEQQGRCSSLCLMDYNNRCGCCFNAVSQQDVEELHEAAVHISSTTCYRESWLISISLPRVYNVIRRQTICSSLPNEELKNPERKKM